MIKLKNLITEFGGKQFKGAEGIPANKSLEKISKTEKLNIIKGKGNIIDFIVPDEYKGKRNFWQVISAGNIKKSSSGKYVMLMGGGLINSPSFDTIDDLNQNVKVSDELFVPVDVNLIGDQEAGFSTDKSGLSDDTLNWSGVIKDSLPKLRWIGRSC